MTVDNQLKEHERKKKVECINVCIFFIDMHSNSQMSRRSLKTNHQNPDALQVLGDGIKNFVVSIIKESVESYCLSPGKVVRGRSPRTKGNRRFSR